MDLTHDVEARVVRRQQPECVDLARHRHRFDAVEDARRPKPEATRHLGDPRAALGRTAEDAADTDIADPKHGLQMERGDEAGPDETDAQRREFRWFVHA